MRTDRDVMYWTQIARGHCSQWFDFSKQWTAFGKVLNQTKHFLPAIDTCCRLRNSVNTKNMLWIHIQSGVKFWAWVITNGFPLTSELGRAFRSVPAWLDDSSLCRAVLSEAEYVPDPLPTTCPVPPPSHCFLQESIPQLPERLLLGTTDLRLLLQAAEFQKFIWDSQWAFLRNNVLNDD